MYLKQEIGVTELAEEVLKKEEKEGRYWEYDADKDLIYFYDNKGFWRIENPHYLKTYIRKYILSVDKSLDRSSLFNEIYFALKAILTDHENRTKFDYNTKNDYSLINVKNGMLDWRNGKLLSHDKSNYSLCQLNVEYDEKADCPRWEKALQEWLPDEDAQLFLQEYIGYCLVPDTSGDKAVILLGEGSNGKSTFLETISYLFGGNNIQNISLNRIGNRFETAHLQNILINVCADTNPTYLRNTGIIKSIISGGNIRGEYKNGASFDFKPFVRLILSANEIPKSRDKTYAWYRRFQIIEFPNKFKVKSEPRFEEKLILEISGIFNWAVAGLRRLKYQGCFTSSEETDYQIHNYKNRVNDIIPAFLAKETIKHDESFIVVNELYEDYVQYCEILLEPAEVKSVFGRRMSELGYKSMVKSIDGKNQRCYVGLAKAP